MVRFQQIYSTMKKFKIFGFGNLDLNNLSHMHGNTISRYLVLHYNENR